MKGEIFLIFQLHRKLNPLLFFVRGNDGFYAAKKPKASMFWTEVHRETVANGSSGLQWTSWNVQHED